MMSKTQRHIDIIYRIFTVLEEYVGDQFDASKLYQFADELVTLSKKETDPYKIDARGFSTHFSAPVDRKIKSENFDLFCSEFNFEVVFEGEGELDEGYRRFQDINNSF